MGPISKLWVKLFRAHKTITGELRVAKVVEVGRVGASEEVAGEVLVGSSSQHLTLLRSKAECQAESGVSCSDSKVSILPEVLALKIDILSQPEAQIGKR